MRDSTNGFAAVEAVHLLGLAALGGVVLLFALSVFGVAKLGQTPAGAARGLQPLFLTALGVMLATGVLLTASKPLRYFLSDAYRLKLALLVLGVALYLYLGRRIVSRAPDAAASGDRALAAALLALWLGVGLAGRFIGLL
jgi:predicted tellurium resistance membrane protein TerC